jgi:hypothetical protein
VSADHLGVSRQRLKQLRDEKRLIGLRLPLRRGYIYPAWQFDPETGQPFAGVPQIIEAAGKSHLNALSLHLLMVSAAAERGTTPAEWLADGDLDYVVGIIAAAGEQGA